MEQVYTDELEQGVDLIAAKTQEKENFLRYRRKNLGSIEMNDSLPEVIYKMYEHNKHVNSKLKNIAVEEARFNNLLLQFWTVLELV